LGINQAISRYETPSHGVIVRALLSSLQAESFTTNIVDGISLIGDAAGADNNTVEVTGARATY
jgi:hypothetical protein